MLSRFLKTNLARMFASVRFFAKPCGYELSCLRAQRGEGLSTAVNQHKQNIDHCFHLPGIRFTNNFYRKFPEIINQIYRRSLSTCHSFQDLNTYLTIKCTNQSLFYSSIQGCDRSKNYGSAIR